MKNQGLLNQKSRLTSPASKWPAANEQQYAAAVRDYELAKQNYAEMVEAGSLETAQNLEEHKAGQNLEVLDPASLPERPEPNRLGHRGESAPCWG